MLYFGTKLLGAALLLSQAVAGIAIPQLTPRADPTCTGSLNGPNPADCKKALEKIAKVKPEICTFIFATEWNYATVGSCTIHTYSEAGKAHCLDGNLIHEGVNAILNHCTLTTTGGTYSWSAGEGVSLVPAY